LYFFVVRELFHHSCAVVGIKKNPIGEGVKPKKLVGKKKDKFCKSIDALCNSMIFIKEHAKKDPEMAAKIKDSGIMDSIWKSFFNLNDIPHQALQHAKLLNLCLQDPELTDPLIESAKTNDAALPINNALSKHRDDPEIMAEVIPLALILCEKSPEIAKEIDTRALIPILLDEGRGLLAEIGEGNLNDDPEATKK